VPTFYVDETGFTGEDLLDKDQPIFVQASNDFSAQEADKIIADIFKGVKAAELKHSSQSRKPAGQARIVELIKLLASDPNRVATWIAHKEYAVVTLIVEWWAEPLAYEGGLNLYENGGNQAMANMIYLCLQGFWDEHFRRKVLLAFQKMFRARTRERFDECQALITEIRNAALLHDGKYEVIRYLWVSFALLGFDHITRLPPRVMDLALPGLVRLGHHWRAKHEGPWEVVHDRSSNMAKQKWLWDALSATDLGEAHFESVHGGSTFPMNVVSTRFADSALEKPIQICDLLAGATAASVKLPPGDAYREQLWEAGIDKLIADTIWPSTAVTPEDLGRVGWDGNRAIEWISEAVAKKRAKTEPPVG
jgi:hypothetical protein